jgi:hypothetical protein
MFSFVIACGYVVITHCAVLIYAAVPDSVERVTVTSSRANDHSDIELFGFCRKIVKSTGRSDSPVLVTYTGGRLMV